MKKIYIQHLAMLIWTAGSLLSSHCYSMDVAQTSASQKSEPPRAWHDTRFNRQETFALSRRMRRTQNPNNHFGRIPLDLIKMLDKYLAYNIYQAHVDENKGLWQKAITEHNPRLNDAFESLFNCIKS